MTEANPRSADHPIETLFLDRWSPRAFTGEGISESELRTFFEAARWAPSAYNSQPWRFVYARRDNAYFDKLLGLLVPFNQSWAKTASALVFVVSAKTFVAPGKTEATPSYSHSFDAGAAWAALALQATASGWYTHAMAGFDHEAAYAALNIPAAEYRIEAAVAIGKRAPKEQLPEALQARETPSPRKPVSEFVFEGGF
jgi:nitroreductase